MASQQPVPTPPGTEESKTYLIKRYDDQIGYYWRASRRNKRAYKASRVLTVVLGAVVTLSASMSSASFIEGTGWKVVFAVMTPLLAALLAIAGGFSQSFQYGAAWSDMVMTAEQLAAERDRLTVTPAADIDAAAELGILNNLIVAESRNFFDRILGSQKPAAGGD